jgi:hypothetical protein
MFEPVLGVGVPLLFAWPELALAPDELPDSAGEPLAPAPDVGPPVSTAAWDAHPTPLTTNHPETNTLDTRN